ncbi:MAG: sulfatase [Gemmatimonadetes bacterium]|nr:sulfatase [Gemmatimonadota bacterium]
MTDPRTPATVGLLDGLLFLLGAGLFTGLLDAGWFAFQRVALHQITFIPPEALWVAPPVYAAVFLGLGLPLLLVGLLRPAWAPLLAPAVALTLLTATLLFIFAGNRLATTALVLLSLGVGIRGGQWIGARFARWAPGLRRASLALLLVTAAGAGAGLWSRRVALAAGRAGTALPNVLLIILDTVRAESLSLYGYPRPTTPRMDEFARGGVVFDSAMSVTSWTLPSHGSMFTGRYHQEISTDWLRPLDAADRVLAEAFRDAGYSTAAFVANLAYTTRESGLARGFETFRDYKFTLRQAWLDCSLCAGVTLRYTGTKRFRRDNEPKSGAEVNAEFLQWLDARRPERFFVFLNLFDAHAPRPRIPAGSPWDAGNRLQDRYDYAINLTDGYVGALLDSLQARGILDSTLVVIASDHGEHMGEHGLKEHGNSLYLPVLHVPLLLRGPGVAAGARVRRLVTLRDLAETIRATVQLPGAPFPGVSLAPLWQGADSATPSPVLAQIIKGINTPPSDPVTSGTMNAVLGHDLHYVLWGDGREELYRLSTDPAAATNLAAQPAQQAVLDSARAALRALLTPGWQGSAPVPAPGTVGKVGQ